jgi:hypothetical protein
MCSKFDLIFSSLSRLIFNTFFDSDILTLDMEAPLASAPSAAALVSFTDDGIHSRASDAGSIKDSDSDAGSTATMNT